MKKKQILLALFLLFLFLANVRSQSRQDRFMLMWYDHSTQSTPITTMAQNYKNLQDHNFNSALVWFRLTHTALNSNAISLQYASSNPSKAFMDSAYKYNIKIILTTPDNCLLRGYGSYGANSYDNLISQQGLAYWGNHPALWGFHIHDEPKGDYFLDLIPFANDIRSFNSKFLRFVNLLPLYHYDKYGSFSYQIHLPVYLNSVQPNILSFDRYPIAAFDSPNDLFKSLDTISRISVERGIPFNYVFTSLGPDFVTVFPNYLVTGYFMYSALFYGAKGLSHWNDNRQLSSSSFSSNYRNLVKKINKKITDNEDILLSLQFRSAYHKSIKSTIRTDDEVIPAYSSWSNFSSDPLANEIFNISNPFVASSASTIDSLAVSFMTDNLENRFFWIFNKSLTSSEIIKLNLKNGSGVVDIFSDNYCLLYENIYIQLEPAEAKLFKFVPNKDMATTNEITENTIWNRKRVVYEKIVVKPSVSLTITNTIFFGPNGTVIVEPAAKLIIDGGVLTNACK